jgi:hypothetical protein
LQGRIERRDGGKVLFVIGHHGQAVRSGDGGNLGVGIIKLIENAGTELLLSISCAAPDRMPAFRDFQAFEIG